MLERLDGACVHSTSWSIFLPSSIRMTNLNLQQMSDSRLAIFSVLALFGVSRLYCWMFCRSLLQRDLYRCVKAVVDCPSWLECSCRACVHLHPHQSSAAGFLTAVCCTLIT